MRRGRCPCCGRLLVCEERGGHVCPVCGADLMVAFLPEDETVVMRRVPATTPDPWPEAVAA